MHEAASWLKIIIIKAKHGKLKEGEDKCFIYEAPASTRVKECKKRTIGSPLSILFLRTNSIIQCYVVVISRVFPLLTICLVLHTYDTVEVTVYLIFFYS